MVSIGISDEELHRMSLRSGGMISTNFYEGEHEINDRAAQKDILEDLIARDWELMKEWELDIEPEIKPLILVQSGEGRLFNGHGRVYDRFGPTPGAAINTIVEAMDMDRYDVMAKRMDYILSAMQFFMDLAGGAMQKTYVDAKGRPLMGITMLKNVKVVDALAALQGFVVQGYLDNEETRRAAVLHFRTTINEMPLHIGAGRCVYIDLERLYEAMGTVEDLGIRAHSEREIEEMKGRMIIVPPDFAGHPFVEQQYIRTVEGPGCCDDAAIINAHWMFDTRGIDAFIGALVNDAIDTLDKYVHLISPDNRGWDEYSARMVENAHFETAGNALVRESDKRLNVYAAAKANTPYALHFSDSYRRQHEHPRRDETATRTRDHTRNEYNLQFATGRLHRKGKVVVDKFPMGFEGVSSRLAYPTLEFRKCPVYEMRESA